MSTYKLQKIELIPQGYYPCTIKTVESVDGEYGPQEKFTLSLQGNRELTAWASAKFNTKSKMFRWVQAVLFDGRSVPDNYELNTTAFVGKSAIANVTIRVKTTGDQYNKVEDLLPANLGVAQAAPQAILVQQPAAKAAVPPAPEEPTEEFFAQQSLSGWTEETPPF